MADILLKMFDPNDGVTLLYTYHIKNRESFIDGLEMPSTQVAMPEQGASKAQITKLEGNTEKITISWLLTEPASGVATLVDQLTGGNAILTPMQQWNFLRNTIQNKGITYKYNLSIENASPAFSVDGVIESLVFEQSKETADKLKATIEFSIGDVITVTSS